jgi:hypothetical protein
LAVRRGTPHSREPFLPPHPQFYGRTAEEFANSDAIIKAHYQGRVTNEDRKRFYTVKPQKKTGGYRRNANLVPTAQEEQQLGKAVHNCTMADVPVQWAAAIRWMPQFLSAAKVSAIRSSLAANR